MNNLIKYISFVVSVFLLSCNSMPDINNATMLDGNVISDPLLTHPENYLVSAYIPSPTEIQKNTPVIRVC